MSIDNSTLLYLSPTMPPKRSSKVAKRKRQPENSPEPIPESLPAQETQFIGPPPTSLDLPVRDDLSSVPAELESFDLAIPTENQSSQRGSREAAADATPSPIATAFEYGWADFPWLPNYSEHPGPSSAN
ncbi:hypothetical protein EJ04DRAFT_179357 [Polyplosphaeria fusca]|uniref:Uncharacterized protein n=1 Tax=Polyplosphaeria fusca TaxID=682080 RepID=A0A9P4QHU2_9PLEO|nr:hypothetical protein EJ04DRAFT_179357 [Polyplosphaeria fusca]